MSFAQTRTDPEVAFFAIAIITGAAIIGVIIFIFTMITETASTAKEVRQQPTNISVQRKHKSNKRVLYIVLGFPVAYFLLWVLNGIYSRIF